MRLIRAKTHFYIPWLAVLTLAAACAGFSGSRVLAIRRHARVVTGRPATPALDRAIADRAAEARAITVATRAGRPEMR
jgi:hypothetical protein